MRINRSLLNWGVFLIALGGIPLAVDQGWIDADIAGDLMRLWPLILVGIGLGLILRWTPFAWFGGALVAATFGILFGAAVTAVPDDVGDLQGVIPAIASGACSSEGAGPASTSEGGLANESTFKLDLTLSCGELSVARAAGATWSVEAAHKTGDAPRIRETDRDGATAILALDDDGTEEIAFLGRQARSDWRVDVPAAAELSVDTTLNAVRGDLDLGPGPIGRLDGTFNASDVTVDAASTTTPAEAAMNLTLNATDATLLLPDGDVRGDITLNASSLTVCVPSSAALRVETSSVLSSDDLGSSGLSESSTGVWTTSGYSSAGDSVDIAISSTVSSFSIERPETCS